MWVFRLLDRELRHLAFVDFLDFLDAQTWLHASERQRRERAIRRGEEITDGSTKVLHEHFGLLDLHGTEHRPGQMDPSVPSQGRRPRTSCE